MSIILWPRQEVLQLVIPELAVVGRVLNASTAMNVIRRLTRYQSTEGKLRCVPLLSSPLLHRIITLLVTSSNRYRKLLISYPQLALIDGWSLRRMFFGGTTTASSCSGTWLL